MWGKKWNPQKPTKVDGNDTTILSHHPYILCHFANYAFVFVICVHRRAAEGSWTANADIGTCRAVCVPGQDLATPHLMRNCGKHILSLHCTLYVHQCVRKPAYNI